MHQFEIYLGSQEKQGRQCKHGVYFEVVDKLCKALYFKNHFVFFDNLYTSIQLLLHLLHHGVYACGTLRAGRKFIPEVVSKPGKMARGDMKNFQDQNWSTI